MRIVVGIPARMGSSRFPGKPLCKILDKTMIEHIYKRCKLSNADEVFVATCDKEIEDEVIRFGGNAIMTDKKIKRPALRIAEACKTLNLDYEDIVIVVQGDEPLVCPSMINLTIQTLLRDPYLTCTNLAKEATKEEWLDSNEIKVVMDEDNYAMYMSRSPIPSDTREKNPLIWKQVCIFGFRWRSLEGLNKLPLGILESMESIEMLRFLENRHKVKMIPIIFKCKSVDTEEDRKQVEEMMKNDKIYQEYS